MQLSKRNIIIILTVLAVILAVGVAYYFWKGRSIPATTTTTTKATVESDIDEEVKELDSLMDAVKDDDFGSEALSDKEVGL